MRTKNLLKLKVTLKINVKNELNNVIILCVKEVEYYIDQWLI